MAKVKDTLRRYKWWFCGLVVSGTCLYLSNSSQFKKEPPKKQRIEAAVKIPQVALPVAGDSFKDNPQEKQKLIGYSMVDAFKHGVINSVSDYVRQAPHKTDTVRFNGDFSQVITYAYYQKVNGKKEVFISHIEPDTLSIPEASPRLKKMIASFARLHNDSMQIMMNKAHECGHQATDPDEKTAQDIHLSDITRRSVFEYNTTPQEFALICAHSELVGRLWSLSYLRERYMEEGNPNIFKGDFRFYGQAVRDGLVDPMNEDADARANERLFVVKSLQDQWNNTHTLNYENYITERMEEHIPFDRQKDSEYDKALDFLYTVIWDGELVNMNYVSKGNLPELQITETARQAVARREIAERKTENLKNQPQVRNTLPNAARSRGGY
ncbi:MAG: hypothetical protein IJ689_04250 [Alphaproteobacteria bacterium]|nr:hypothetical protein [Alphaproteobacteria bacterium]